MVKWKFLLKNLPHYTFPNQPMVYSIQKVTGEPNRTTNNDFISKIHIPEADKLIVRDKHPICMRQFP